MYIKPSLFCWSYLCSSECNARYTHQLIPTAQKIHYPPTNHHASLFSKCPISRSITTMLTTGTDDPALSLLAERQWVKGHQYRCRSSVPGNMTFVEVASMVVSWWMVLFAQCIYRILIAHMYFVAHLCIMCNLPVMCTWLCSFTCTLQEIECVWLWNVALYLLTWYRLHPITLIHYTTLSSAVMSITCTINS